METERSRKHRDSAVYRRVRKQVFRERGDVCGICGQPIEHERYTWPHPKSRVLHHTHAIARGGPLANPATMVAAHKICNERVGTGRRAPRTPGDRSARW